MSRIRIIFLGTPEFAVPSLEALHKDEHFEITAVVSQPDRPRGRNQQLSPSPVKQRALALGLPVITPEKVRDPQVLAEIKSYGAEAAVVVAFGQILPQAFFELFTFGAVNIHSSVLPRWRGAAPMQRAIMAGDSETGVCLQKMVLKLDAGQVLGLRRVGISASMNCIELHDRLKILACELLEVEFMDYLRGNLAGTEQDESLATHAAKLDKAEGLIDWNKSAKHISCQVRGLALGPGAWSFRHGKMLKLHKVTALAGSASVGTVSETGSDFFVVGCGAGLLKIEEVQPESKARMSVRDYLRGYAVIKGEKLG